MSVDNLSIVVGAGVAGLTLASRIAARGDKVLVLEQGKSVGGLGGSFRYDNFVFDLGPHRFHTDDREVLSFIEEVLGDDILVIRRSSAVYMAGKFIPWPLTAAAIRHLPPKMLLGSALDIFRRKAEDGETFDAYIIRRYGSTLYRTFFEPYTVKFLGLPCEQISRDWAITGIDRAVIDKGSAVDDLFSLASSLLRCEKPLEFIYPGSGGINVFSEKLARRIRGTGGSIQLGAGVTGLDVGAEGLNVHTAAGSHACARVYWSGSLHDLAGCLRIAPPDLEYLSMLLFNYRVAAPCRIPFQWCYFGEAHIPFNRVSFPTNFNPSLAPAGSSGVCVEVTARRGDATWENPMQLEPDIRRTLVRLGLAPSFDAVTGVAYEKIRDAYPVYRLGYRERAEAFLRALPQGIIPFGRTGGFWYNNMDNSIAEALRIAGSPVKEKMVHG